MGMHEQWQQNLGDDRLKKYLSERDSEHFFLNDPIWTYYGSMWYHIPTAAKYKLNQRETFFATLHMACNNLFRFNLIIDTFLVRLDFHLWHARLNHTWL